MSRSGNYSMLTQAQQALKDEGKDSNNISALHRMTGLSWDTVRKYLKDGVQPHGNSKRTKGSKLDSFKELLQEQFELGNFNSESLFSLLQRKGYLGKKSILKEYIKKFRPKPTATNVPIQTMRFETEMGEQLQMDWGFSSYVAEGKKREHKIACLVMILGYSRQRYVEFFSSARQENLFVGMTHGFQYFGGIPKSVLTDNMKSVVQSRNKNVIILNARYEHFQAEMGFSTRLCKARTPQTKGYVKKYVS